MRLTKEDTEKIVAFIWEEAKTNIRLGGNERVNREIANREATRVRHRYLRQERLFDNSEYLLKAVSELNKAIDKYFNDGHTDFQIKIINECQQECERIIDKIGKP